MLQKNCDILNPFFSLVQSIIHNLCTPKLKEMSEKKKIVKTKCHFFCNGIYKNPNRKKKKNHNLLINWRDTFIQHQFEDPRYTCITTCIHWHLKTSESVYDILDSSLLWTNMYHIKLYDYRVTLCFLSPYLDIMHT
jgi:hypothetical protein